MSTNQQKKLKNVFLKLKPQTEICKLCFKPIKYDNLYSIFHKKCFLCSSCFDRLVPRFDYFQIDNIDAVAIYHYDDEIRSILYQFKGCYDIELSDVFLCRYIEEINVKFYDYYIVPIPSYEGADEAREFNHVIEMFKKLKIRYLQILKKTAEIKQASSNFAKRQEIAEFLVLSDSRSLKGKKILIVDDVCTTGSTLKAAIKLISSLNPDKIKVLVMSRRISSDDNSKKMNIRQRIHKVFDR